MDVGHEMGGNIVITLTYEDYLQSVIDGHIVANQGLRDNSQTWVRSELEEGEDPHAEIDLDDNLYVFIPIGTALPVRIEQENVTLFKDTDRSRLERFFGKMGAIVVNWAGDS